jgi:hypothetical protein
VNAPLRRLTPKIHAIIGASAEVRLEALKAQPFVAYGAAKRISDRLEELLISKRSHRPASILISGPTNNGKTMLVNRFIGLHPPDDDPSAEAIIAKVLYVQMPPTPDPRQFYTSILDRLNAPVRRTAILSQLQSQALRLVGAVGLKVLVIDELHNIHSGRVEQQRAFLNVLRYVSNEKQIHLVGCGLITAVRALQSDEQLANRFEHWPLPKWTSENGTRALLNTLESTLPLQRASGLSEPDIMSRVLALSGGTIGEIVRLVNAAAAEAIQNGAERIDASVIDGLRWIPPDDRRRAAELSLGYRD